MSETSTARVHAWEAVIESDSTTVAGTHAGYHTTTLMAGPGSGKSHFLLRVPFLLATFYKEQAQHESARNVQKIVSSFLTPPQHPQATMTCYMPIGFPLADGSVIAGQAMTLTSTTLSIPRSCTMGGHLLATTASVIVPAPFSQLAAMENNITKFDPMTTRQVARHVEQAFASATEETFEDGVHSKFEKTLSSLIRVSGNSALKAIEQMVASPNTNEEIAGEALRRIGEVVDEASRKYRLDVLTRALRSPSSRLRYAAAIGLASMDEPDAIPPILEAMAVESYPIVLRTFRQVLEQLEDTARCRGI